MRTVQKLSVFARFLPDHDAGKKADVCRSGEFRPLRDEVEDDLPVRMNCANPGDHEPTTERANCTLKGRV